MRSSEMPKNWTEMTNYEKKKYAVIYGSITRVVYPDKKSSRQSAFKLTSQLWQRNARPFKQKRHFLVCSAASEVQTNLLAETNLETLSCTNLYFQKYPESTSKARSKAVILVNTMQANKNHSNHGLQFFWIKNIYFQHTFTKLTHWVIHFSWSSRKKK